MYKILPVSLPWSSRDRVNPVLKLSALPSQLSDTFLSPTASGSTPFSSRYWLNDRVAVTATEPQKLASSAGGEEQVPGNPAATLGEFHV